MNARPGKDGVGSAPSRKAEPAAASASAPLAAQPPSSTPRSGVGALLGSAILGGLVGAAFTAGIEQVISRPATEGIETRLAVLERRPAVSVDPGLANRVAALEAAQKSSAGSEAAGQIPAIDGRLKALEDASKGSAASAGAIDDLRRQVSALSTRTDDVAKQAGAGAQSGATALAELTARVAAVSGQAAQQAQAQASALGAMQARLADTDKRLGAIDAAFAKYGPDTAQAGLRIVLAQRLDAALRNGQPLGGTIDALARLGAPPATIDALRPYASTGAPNLAAFAAEFRSLGDRTVEAARGPATSVGDRLLRMAERVVTVRTVGESGGGDVADIVAAIETALARGDADAAAAAWDRLPDGSKPISADWAARLKARNAAGAAASRVSADALASIDAALR